MPNPWNGKVVLETFWWNCWNGTYPFDWYTYLAKLTPRLAAMGIDGIWTPPPCKDTNAQNNMGYTPYDYYDLGQKDQRGAIGTRFGNMDSFLRLVVLRMPTVSRSTPTLFSITAQAAIRIPLRRFSPAPSSSPAFTQMAMLVQALGDGRATGSTSTSIPSIGARKGTGRPPRPTASAQTFVIKGGAVIQEPQIPTVPCAATLAPGSPGSSGKPVSTASDSMMWTATRRRLWRTYFTTSWVIGLSTSRWAST